MKSMKSIAGRFGVWEDDGDGNYGWRSPHSTEDVEKDGSS